MKQPVILSAEEVLKMKPFLVNKQKVMPSIAGKPINNPVIEALVSDGIRKFV